MKYGVIAVIYNPNSTGSGKVLAEGFAAEIRTALPSQKIELIETQHAGHAEELAYDLAHSYDHPLVISSSGDGGYHEVVNGSMKAQKEGLHVSTGLLPAGNANDHFHSLHSDPIVERIVQDNAIEIDVLRIDASVEGQTIERYAHSYIGFGLSPFVGKQLNKNELTRVKEMAITLRSVLRYRPVDLIIDGVARPYGSVIVSNIDTMAKHLTVSQASSVSDGIFEVTLHPYRSILQLLSTFIKGSVGSMNEDKRLDTFSCKTTGVTLVQADGEIKSIDANTQVDIVIEHEALRCFV